VVYCINVTNTGDSYLGSVTVSNPVLDFETVVPLLAPGQTKMLPVPGTIIGDLANFATVSGNPVLASGIDIPGMDDVTGQGQSAVGIIPHSPSIQVDNTVYLGNDDGQSCRGVDYVENFNGAAVVYCFEVTNTGNSYLKDVKLVNEQLKFTDSTTVPMLAPGETVTVALASSIDGNLKNIANVTSDCVLQSGEIIPGYGKITDTDSSTVGQLKYYPAVSIENKGMQELPQPGILAKKRFLLDLYVPNLIWLVVFRFDPQCTLEMTWVPLVALQLRR
jgi:hypothetical protein